MGNSNSCTNTDQNENTKPRYEYLDAQDAGEKEADKWKVDANDGCPFGYPEFSDHCPDNHYEVLKIHKPKVINAGCLIIRDKDEQDKYRADQDWGHSTPPTYTHSIGNAKWYRSWISSSDKNQCISRD